MVLACRDLWEHERFAVGSIPGYCSLTFSDRLRLDTKACGLFLRSAAAFRLFCLLIIWQLAGYLLVWRWDMHVMALAMPPLTALPWLLPAVAVLRRRFLGQLLQQFRYPT
jgi:hypothetical protein